MGLRKPILYRSVLRDRMWCRPRGQQKTARSAVSDHDLSEMTTALEMPVSCLGLGERECPVDHGAQAMQCDGPVHRLKMARLPTLIAPTVVPRPVSNKGSSIIPDGDRLAPIRLTCPPTAKAFSV